MSQKITATHERGDAIPALIAPRKQRRVAAFLDTPFPTKGHGEGWRLGWPTVVWSACILSEGDHRLARVEPWDQEPPRPLTRGIDRKVSPRARAADRLAPILDDRCGAAPWAACTRARHQAVGRVDAWQRRVVRLDPTTAVGDATPAGLVPRGPRKAHCPALPQVKRAMAVLAPLGFPLTTPGVAGPTAADPR
jgi:hypothetical protein